MPVDHIQAINVWVFDDFSRHETMIPITQKVVHVEEHCFHMEQESTGSGNVVGGQSTLISSPVDYFFLQWV